MPINRYGWFQAGVFDSLDGEGPNHQWTRPYRNTGDETNTYLLPIEDGIAFVFRAWLELPGAPAGGASTGTSSVNLAGVTGSATATAIAGGASTQTLAGTTGNTDADAIAGGSSSQTLAGTTGSATGGVQNRGTSTVTLAGVTGTANGGSGTVEWGRVTYTRLETPAAMPVAIGTSSKALTGAFGSADAKAIATGTSSASLAGVTGSATGGAVSVEVGRVSATNFLVPLAPPAPIIGTSTKTYAGVTGVAFGGGTAVEWARAVWARMEVPAATVPFYVETPIATAPITMSVTITGTIDLVPGLYGTSAKTLAGVTGSGSGLVGTVPDGSIANVQGVTGTASGGVTVGGSSVATLGGVTGFADTEPTVTRFGASDRTLTGVFGSATATAIIGGVSSQVLGGVFAGISGDSTKTYEGVSGVARGGLRLTTGRKMRMPGTQSIQQVRPK